MQAINTPFYQDWTFWSVIIAFSAIILSQIPPIHLLFRSAKLSLDLYSKIHITHKVGNANLQLHLILNNVGGRAVRIQGIEVTIFRDGREVARLPAQNFLQNQNDSGTFLFTKFSLAPGHEWAHIVNFWNDLSRDDANEFFRIQRELRADLFQKKAERDRMPPDGNNNNLIELDGALVAAAISMHNRLFLWRPGDYRMRVSVATENNSADVSKEYRFTLFESQSATLEEMKDHYKYGGGIWWNPDNVLIGQIIDLEEG